MPESASSQTPLEGGLSCASVGDSGPGPISAPRWQADMGFVHSFTTGSAVDGPGVRVVVWTAGCMWRCRYCHNPDTWTMSNGIPVSVTRAVEVLGKYRHGLKAMGGGFTLSGGDPLMQHRFAAKLLAAATSMGIHHRRDHPFLR
jgi:pyruvate formate lyase activating enzyme